MDIFVKVREVGEYHMVSEFMKIASNYLVRGGVKLSR